MREGKKERKKEREREEQERRTRHNKTVEGTDPEAKQKLGICCKIGKIGFKEFDGNKLNKCPEKGIAQILFNFLVGKPVSEEEEEE